MKIPAKILILAFIPFVLFLLFFVLRPKLTDAEAINKVKEIPAVKELQSRFDNQHKKPLHYLAEDKGHAWMIQVFETVEDSTPGAEIRESHTATYGWYQVDKKSGAIWDDIELKPVN